MNNLRLFDQEILSDKETGTHGDCFRACLRTLFQHPFRDCPHPIAEDGESWNEDLWDYLEGHTFEPTYYPFRKDKDYSYLHTPVRRVVIACGATVRTSITGATHSVIWDMQSQMLIHDPHPSRAGIITFDGFWTKGEVSG